MADWLERNREAARGRFEGAEWPTTTVEEWRRTDLKRWAPKGIPTTTSAVVVAAEPSRARRTTAEEIVDGLLHLRGSKAVDHALSETARKAGVQLAPLQDALTLGNGSLEAIFTRGLERADNRFQFWHYHVWSTGVYLRVPAGVKLARPVRIELETSPEGGAEHPHVVVVLGEGAEAEVVVVASGAAVGTVWNATTDLWVGADATLRYAELQALGPEALVFHHATAVVGENARLRHASAVFGGKLHKSRLACDLEGRGADVELDGVYFTDASQHVDITTIQRHLAPGSRTRTLYKGAAKDASSTVFQGLIDVAEGASRTDAYLSNRNLVLGDTARANSLPSLAIRNNDLRCTHGSTTSRIDPEHRFYLMSRGLTREEADQMLVHGWFEEVLATTPEPLAERAREIVARKLSG